MEITKEKEDDASKSKCKKTVRIPLVGQPEKFALYPFDEQKFINVMPETVKNTTTGTKKLHVVQRPGISPYIVHTSKTEGRGIWTFKTLLIYVFDSTLYLYNFTDLSTVSITLLTSTGACGGTEVSNNQFFFCDGINGYIIYPDASYTNIEESYLRWTASTILEAGDKRIPTSYDSATSTRYYYTASITSGDSTGTTASSEPTWPTTIGNTVTDGDITWTCTASQSTMAVKWKASHAYAVGNFVQPVVENSLYYIVTASDGAAGTTQPTWPLTIGESVTQDGVTYECVGYYGGFPSPHVPTPVFMDGYIFLPEEDSIDIYNSGVFSNFSWSPLDFISAENFPDKVVALARQANFVVAFGSNSTELLYDAANEEGSPLLRNENFVLQVGLLQKEVIFQTEKYLMWMAKSPVGRLSIWTLNGYEAREVSTEVIERAISEDSTIYDFKGFGIRIKGHILFVINAYNFDGVCLRTFVYDLEEELWHEWQYNNNGFPSFYAVASYGTGDPQIYGISYKESSGGIVYIYTPTIPNDLIFSDPDIVNITTSLEIRLSPQDFGNSKRKFFHRAELVCDNSLGTFNISWILPDGTYTTPRSLAENGTERKFITQCGSDRRRYWKLNIVPSTSGTPFRGEALEIVYTQGEN